jgi:hypothetical protein
MANLKTRVTGKLSQIYLICRSYIIRILRRHKVHIIPIDGGLGSQILQFTLYAWLKREGKRVFLDARYFDEQSAPESGNWVTQRTWKLDSFGHHIKDQNLGSGSRLRDKDFMRLYFKHYEESLQDKDFLNMLFPLNTKEMQNVLNLVGLSEDKLDTAVLIHIRQGDFLTAASLLLNEDYYIKALKYVQSQIEVSNVIIVSDEVINSNRFPQISELLAADTQKSRAIIGGDDHVIHNLMRNCKALICSNSTYSFTAAMLKTKGIIVYPSEFYRGETSALNPIFKLELGIEISSV